MSVAKADGLPLVFSEGMDIMITLPDQRRMKNRQPPILADLHFGGHAQVA